MSTCNCTGKCRVYPYTCNGKPCDEKSGLGGKYSLISDLDPKEGFTIELKDDDTLITRLKRYDELLKQYIRPGERKDIDRLEQRFKCIELRLSKLGVFNTPSKIPHKCPVCDGTGNKDLRQEVIIKIIENGQVKLLRCLACDGTGIVWEIV